jgi:hypothetical protein
MEIPVFINGRFLQYKVPRDIPLWSMCHKLQAASFYAAAVQKGHTLQQSSVLAECFINKQLYKDLHYKKSIEDLLQTMIL